MTITVDSLREQLKGQHVFRDGLRPIDVAVELKIAEIQKLEDDQWKATAREAAIQAGMPSNASGLEYSPSGRSETCVRYDAGCWLTGFFFGGYDNKFRRWVDAQKKSVRVEKSALHLYNREPIPESALEKVREAMDKGYALADMSVHWPVVEAMPYVYRDPIITVNVNGQEYEIARW